MLTKKLHFTLLNENWENIGNIKLVSKPSYSEFVWYNGKYYEVLRVVHSHDQRNIFLVVEEKNLGVIG